MILTTTQIVQLCSKMGALSSSQAGLVTSDFVNIANLVMTTLTAELLGAREEYLIWTDSIPVVAGQTAVRIPYRAINTTVRHVWWEDGTGSRFRLWGRAIEDIEGYSTTDTGTPTGFYVEGNSIQLLPATTNGGNLLMAYPFRPNLLVDATTTQSVSAVGTNSVTVPNVPTNFTSGALYDIIDHTSGNGIVYYDLVGTVSGNTISFPTDIPNVAVGNYIARAMQSPVPMLPEEGHALLLETTVLRLEMIRGNASRIKNSQVVVQDARKAWDALLLNRIVSKAHPAGSGGPQFPLRPFF